MSIILTQVSTVDPDVYRIMVLILIIVLVMRFILVILQRMLDHKLKNKILDKDPSSDLAATILGTGVSSEKNDSIKWFAILVSTGIGLFITSAFTPLGIHSVGIMTVCMAVGFLGFALFLRLSD